MPERVVIGWDIGGAHVKASWVERGVLRDVTQWACPLWQGLDRLHAVLAEAQARWPQASGAVHAITMTGEMVDLFEHREAGVVALAAAMGDALDGPLWFYAGERGWCAPADVAAQWQAIASANWWATAALAAQALGEGVLVDIGSTTTDLIALRGGTVRAQGRSDAARLQSGELVYQGVSRTPLCALTPRVVFRGRASNVMNEFFATTADVYRLTGELDPAHDLHPAADGGAKDAAATRRRLARMIGLDARDADESDWLAFANAWRELQLDELQGQLERVLLAAPIAASAPLVSAGCGDFLADALARRIGRPCRSVASLLLGDRPQADAALQRRAQVGAPSAAVALLRVRETA
ncbi:hydantoinase/oxoprolinase family protein [Methylibium petroleiphilum]|uniref:S-layer protein, putative n=1 Tax=Methylibium petroleiphilum (strain ATCC BAA-1232 / LMG 22953 / PM1) TaxID=420662 RepID=A2SJ35_METPP|nr:hydantoinase/oxoprolinase family protein [Methylibium petroleiphilum]ABM95574.1 S-layer protein, putative [Methylibium petroleiphilum PM1]